MKKLLYLLVMLVLLTALPAGSVIADEGVPGDCPDGFHAHLVSDMEHEHEGDEHHHAGVSSDKNGDGWICVKHVSADGTVHVHVDNNTELP